MKKKRLKTLSPGMIRTAFLILNNKKVNLGVVELVTRISVGEYFILNEVSEEKTRRYVDEKWKVKFLTFTKKGISLIHKEHPLIFKFRTLARIGLI